MKDNTALLRAAAGADLKTPPQSGANVTPVTGIKDKAGLRPNRPNLLSEHIGSVEGRSAEEQLSSFAEERAGELVELDTNQISWDGSINQRVQEWLNDHNNQYIKLRESIRDFGQQVPIWVVKLDDGTYKGIFGSRRTRSCSDLKVKVKAHVFAEELSEKDAYLAAHIENKNRRGLSPYEVALSVVRYKQLHQNASEADVGRFFDKSRAWVSYQTAFAKADKDMMRCISNPWAVTERAYRQINKHLSTNPKRVEQANSILKKMIEDNVQKPYLKLFALLNPPDALGEPSFKYDDNGRILAQVSPIKVSNGRTYRTISVFEGNAKKEIKDVVGQIVDDIHVDINFNG